MGWWPPAQIKGSGVFTAVQEGDRAELLQAGSEFAAAHAAGTVDLTKAGRSTPE